MKLDQIPALLAYCGNRLSAADLTVTEKIRIENLHVEERVPVEGTMLYGSYIDPTSLVDLDVWVDRHREFVANEIALDSGDTQVPWTFRAENAANRLPLIERRLNLIRVEDARWPCSLSGLSFESVSDSILAMSDPDRMKREAATNLLARLTAAWNAERDQRPLFATIELMVEDVLSDWQSGGAEALRDQLGLGHYSPMPGSPPIPVFVMRYPLEEIYSAHPGGGEPVVPTMLDGGLNDFYFPSPTPGPSSDPNPCLGHCLNLTPTSKENDYKLGVELLHKPIDYGPEHFLRTGTIANPIAMPLDRARQFHLLWLQLYRDRSDFGEGIFS